MTKRLDPDIKALRAIVRALDELPDDRARKRVMEWTVARALGRAWISLPPWFESATGIARVAREDRAAEVRLRGEERVAELEKEANR